MDKPNYVTFFSKENTEGYTQKQLNEMNYELEEFLDETYLDDSLDCENSFKHEQQRILNKY